MALWLAPPPGGAPVAASAVLGQAASLWGLSALCLPSGSPGKPGAHSDPFAALACPPGQVPHDVALAAPPSQPALDAPRQAAGAIRRPDAPAPGHRFFATPQPRAPPAVG